MLDTATEPWGGMMARKFYYTSTYLKCQTCGKPAGYMIRSGGDTYNYACNEAHAKAQVKDLERAWAD